MDKNPLWKIYDKDGRLYSFNSFKELETFIKITIQTGEYEKLSLSGSYKQLLKDSGIKLPGKLKQSDMFQ